ncbi:MAG TPA: hypothetical protein VHX37_03355 [Acidobacteriaceae bacterium]|jgi:uncharacterized membrane protein|nr:hypothetical protein [Acidobacteriaceae bacterium]
MNAPMPSLLAALFLSFYAVALFGMPPIVVATYFAGSVILLIGLIVVFRRDIPRARGLDKIVCLGPVFYAAPLAVFGAEHLTITRAMTGMIPHWIPWHLFWVVFVGIALLAAALSLAVQRLAGVAAALLGVMFLLFDVLLALPGLIHNPGNRFVEALTLRELSFSSCAFAFASTLASARWRGAGERVATAARYVVGVAVTFYGVEHFLHPQFVPVIPLELQMPAWIPFHPLWGYGVGTSLVVAGVAMLANWHARTATTILGIVACAAVAFVYLPILAVHPADIEVGMNYFADTLFFAGALLMLAGSIPPENRKRPAVVEPVAAASGMVG